MRVIQYRLRGVTGAEPLCRLLITVLDDRQAPASELAAVYPERREVETALDELRSHLRGARIVLRSKTPDLVRQAFWGLMLAHFAIRSLMHEAALRSGEDPGRLSYVHAVRVVLRKTVNPGPFFPPNTTTRFRQRVLDEILDERAVSNRNRIKARGVKRKMSNYPLRPRHFVTAKYDPNTALEIIR